ncbi:glycosyltransferase family 2 protein [Enterobacter hormaechei]|uniref:glycosyltransferase family 2 protein n=2 Tax=Enterobacterales TaxID=91347 RepID=UPI001C97D7E9|nr:MULTISPECIES: glycosyltransferase family 2 protein [Enterobacteriaceae]MBY5150588.1 glycosyltransferase family 2 protein [Enterobacter hormaechei]MDQ2129104.1 glycosyltransferase family 2 protein [Leclercia adecarboxylata]MDV7057757.1 glycosyltransferase family 2 protein [Leclercia adecarboxylata]
MNIACVMMQKNESELLPIWIKYYSHLFSPENLYIFDNGSNDANTLEHLKNARNNGVQVIYTHNSPKDFENKGIIIGNKIKEIEGNYDFIFPLDCDEFIGCRTPDGNISFLIDDIENELLKHLDTKETLLFDSQGFNSIISKHHFLFRKDRKCFFRKGTFLSLDVGFHWGKTKFCDGEHRTNLIQLHFHNKPYEIAKEHAREKLKLRVNSFEPDEIKKYNGPGVHMVKYFTMQKEEYLDSFIFQSSTKVSTFEELLLKLCIAWPYDKEMSEASEYVNSKLSMIKRASLRKGLTPPAVHAEFKGHIDKVENINGQTFIYGWASNSSNQRPSYYFVYDGTDFFNIELISPIIRPDVAKHLGTRNNDLGFRLTLPSPLEIDKKTFELFCSDTSHSVGSRLDKNRNI